MRSNTKHAFSFSEAQMDEFVAHTAGSGWDKLAESLTAKLMTHLPLLEIWQIGTISTDARLNWEDVPWLMWSISYNRSIYPVEIFDDEVVCIYDAEGVEHARKKFAEFSFSEILSFAVGFFWVRDSGRIGTKHSWGFSPEQRNAIADRIFQRGWKVRVSEEGARVRAALGLKELACQTLMVANLEGYGRPLGLVCLNIVYNEDSVSSSGYEGAAESDACFFHVYRTSDFALVCAKPWREFSFSDLLEFCTDHVFVSALCFS